MGISASVDVHGRPEDVWSVITNIDDAVQKISAIEEVEILERPDEGLVGLKWRETRQMFGKSATEVMWITDVEPNQLYQTRAERHGSIYVSRLSVEPQGDGSRLTMAFDATPQNLFAKVMGATVGKLFEKATRDALQKDLEDIKAVVEGRG